MVNDIFNLNGKVALITGASSGLGRHFSKTLSEAGATVILSARRMDNLVELQKELNGKSHIFSLDVTSAESVEQLFKEIKKEFGSAEILVNNAGIHMDNILLRMDTKEWKKVLDVNLNGPFYLTRLLLKDMIKNKQGRIINISSISGTDGNKGQSNYSASKGGLLAFTKSLAKEVGRRNITVNCIAPGIIETDMIADLSDTVKTDYLKRIPLKKFGKPEDIGKMILFLCSDEASYITGQTFYIDGGMSLN